MTCEERPSVPIPWRLVVDGSATGYDNMAADEALLEAQKDPAAIPVLRFFRWKVKTMTFGRLQDHHQAANRTMVNGARAMACRPTGGGSVIHDRDLSFSLAWRKDHPGFSRRLKAVFRDIHAAVLGALAELGVEASLAPAGPIPTREGMCFQEPVENDLMWNGKKILGGALRVTSWGRLYEGNLLWAEMGLAEEDVLPAVQRAFEKDFFRSPPAP